MVEDRYTFYPVSTLPVALDVVWCHFPFDEDPNSPAKPRPALVRQTKLRFGRLPYVEVAYGTRKQKLQERPLDFHIANLRDMDIAGLPNPTRFDLDRVRLLPWAEEWFSSRDGYPSPVIGHLSPTSKVRLQLLLKVREARRNENS